MVDNDDTCMMTFPFLMIPEEVFYSKKLSDKDKRIFTVMLPIRLGANGAPLSDEWLAKQAGVRLKTASKSVSNLHKSGFIDVKYVNQNDKIIRYIKIDPRLIP